MRIGAAADSLLQMTIGATEPFDFVFVDADKPNYPQYLELTLQLTHPGSMIVMDNVIRDGEVANADSLDPKVRGVAKLHELVANDDRIEATSIQTVGVKGYDGFLIAVVN